MVKRTATTIISFIVIFKLYIINDWIINIKFVIESQFAEN